MKERVNLSSFKIPDIQTGQKQSIRQKTIENILTISCIQETTNTIYTDQLHMTLNIPSGNESNTENSQVWKVLKEF